MKVGIIGAGNIGQAIARHLAKAGVATVISNNRGPDSLTEFARSLGPSVTASTREEAAAADMVLVAVPWEHHAAALANLPPWKGRIVIDAMNPIIPPGFSVADLSGRTSSEVIADKVPGARLVKAFNTLPPPILSADAHHGGGRRVIVMSGDDSAAKSAVGKLIDRLGFAAIDLGSLLTGGRLQQFPGGPFPALNLISLA